MASCQNAPNVDESNPPAIIMLHFIISNIKMQGIIPPERLGGTSLGHNAGWDAGTSWFALPFVGWQLDRNG
jgi:hypothetical protein